MNWWLVAAGSIAVYVALRMFHNRGNGKHRRDWDSDMFAPKGTVYLVRGEWWTQPRRAFPGPRKFESRSNPLDHDFEWEIQYIPRKEIALPHEVEY